MTSSLAGKIVVVTSATGQVGWGIAHAALDTGATVVLPVRSEAARKKVERDFGKARTSLVTVDFADESSLATMESLIGVRSPRLRASVTSTSKRTRHWV